MTRICLYQYTGKDWSLKYFVLQETMLHKTVIYYIVLSLNPSSSFQTLVFRTEATNYVSVWPGGMNASMQTVHHPHAHAHTHILVHCYALDEHHALELYASLFVSSRLRHYNPYSTHHKQVQVVLTHLHKWTTQQFYYRGSVWCCSPSTQLLLMYWW